MKFLLTLVLALPTLASATCMIQKTTCKSENNFQNIYELEKVSCAAPGGPVRTTETFRIYNTLVSDCGQVYRRGCMKPIVDRKLNTTRHLYLQVDIEQKGKDVFLKIDDRKFLAQGDFHISTPNAEFMLLNGYTCSTKF
jgi:hypothetical protein